MALGKLGFGLMRLPVESGSADEIDQKQLQKMVDLFLEKGFTYFDTSYVYHNGESENAIREALVMRHERDSCTLASKLQTFLICFVVTCEILHRFYRLATPTLPLSVLCVCRA